MIQNEINQAADNLWAQGVTMFYIVMPSDFNKERELALIEMLNEHGFRYVSSRNIIEKYDRNMGKTHVSKLCFIEIMTTNAVIIVDGSEKDSTCLLEIMIAKHSGKHLLNEYLEPAARFNSLEIKFNSDEKSM